ncbi:hypothetical protein R1sor_018684 [Riccia sorocarpa]|uniref:DUF659 domain-containing protein n=1 Tax=Riccia sorocarpa TaxID=122646 RepID=A0ABD3IEI6_9MARC
MADQAEAQDTQDQTAGNDDATPSIPRRDMGRQTILPFGSRPTPQHQDVNYRDMGVRTPKSELARKVMGEYTFRIHEGQSFATCRYCGLEYVYNITRLTTHFTGDHEPRGGALQPRKGSVKHVKVCGSVPYAVKEAIRSLHRNKTSKQREIREDSERQSASAMPDEEDRNIQREFARTILEENLSNTPANEPAPSQRSIHTSPLTPANVSANLPRNPSPLSDITSSRRHIQQPLRPMMDATQRKITDEKWSMALFVMGLPFRTLAHPMFREAYNFSSKLPGYKFPSSTALRTTLFDKNLNDVKKTSEQNMCGHNFCVRGTVSCDGWTNRNGRPQVNLVIVNRYGEMVYDHADGSNVRKDAKWVAANMIRVIREVGPKNVLQFTADNAAVNTLAGQIVRAEFPHIVFGGCVAHGIDLLFEDMAKLPWIKAIFSKCNEIISKVSYRLQGRILANMKTENVEAGLSGSDAGLPQPRDEAGKFTIKHYVVLPNQKPGNPRIRCRYCTFEITHNITRMKHHLTGLKAAPPKASTTLNKKGEKNQQTCQFVPVVVREELTRLMSVQERKSGVEGEHYKACKVEPDEREIRSSQAASPSPGFSSNPDLGQGSMEYNRALRDRSASRTPASSLLGGPESACGLSSLQPERRMPSKSDIRYYHDMKQQREATKSGSGRCMR